MLLRFLSVCFLLALSLLAVPLVSQAEDVPVMTVSFSINGQPADPKLWTQRIGVGTPVVVTWTLENAPDGTRWETCRVPLDRPIAIDSLTPDGEQVMPTQFSFPPETRSVTLTFHATAIQRPDGGSPYSHVSCWATLPDGRSLSASAAWRLGLLPLHDVLLPIGANTMETPVAYPTP